MLTMTDIQRLARLQDNAPDQFQREILTLTPEEVATFETCATCHDVLTGDACTGCCNYPDSPYDLGYNDGWGSIENNITFRSKEDQEMYNKGYDDGRIERQERILSDEWSVNR